MKKILLATNNKYKIQEISDILKDSGYEILSLNDVNIKIEIEEDKETLEENAIKKAEEVFKTAKIPTLADDTGLFVDALKGEPGVFSSRYAGENATYDENCKKLLKVLKDVPEEKRDAHFKTIVCYYVSENKYFLFEGICKGKMIKEKRGEKGFGYDPLFIPDGYDKTYSEMNDNEKNSISHRAKSLEAFKNFLLKYSFTLHP